MTIGLGANVKRRILIAGLLAWCGIFAWSFSITPIGIGFRVPLVLAQPLFSQNCPAGMQAIVGPSWTTSDIQGRLYRWGCTDSFGNLAVGGTLYVSQATGALQTAISNLPSNLGTIELMVPGTYPIPSTIVFNPLGQNISAGIVTLRLRNGVTLQCTMTNNTDCIQYGGSLTIEGIGFSGTQGTPQLTISSTASVRNIIGPASNISTQGPTVVLRNFSINLFNGTVNRSAVDMCCQNNGGGLDGMAIGNVGALGAGASGTYTLFIIDGVNIANAAVPISNGSGFVQNSAINCNQAPGCSTTSIFSATGVATYDWNFTSTFWGFLAATGPMVTANITDGAHGNGAVHNIYFRTPAFQSNALGGCINATNVSDLTITGMDCAYTGTAGSGSFYGVTYSSSQNVSNLFVIDEHVLTIAAVTAQGVVNNVSGTTYGSSTFAVEGSYNWTNPAWNLAFPTMFDGYGLQYGSRTFSTLGTPGNGTTTYCSDCTIANPCAAAGTGALAKRLNSVWVCN